MNTISDTQWFARENKRNTESAGAWELFDGHRNRVTEVLTTDLPVRNGSACLLGAGNCNDIDLNQLLKHVADVCLIDIDEVAVRAGIAGQGLADSNAIQVTAADLSGLAHIIDEPGEQDERVDQCVRAVADLDPPVDEQFDLVASTCLLTQLIDGVHQRFGKSCRLLDLVKAVRLRHLQMLVELCRPGGRGVLITDLVSSQTCPALLETSDEQLPIVVGQALASHNFFTGVNPAVILPLLQTDPMFAQRIENVQATLPWLWNLGPRTYSVYAITFQRRSS